MNYRLPGLIAATYTPMDDHGHLRLEQVDGMVDRLLSEGVSGLYVCGSTGEGMSLSDTERQEVAEAFFTAAGGRTPVVIQVGHNSIVAAQQLSAHAEKIGVNAISATAPSYFKIDSVELLVESMAEIASAAPNTPFYYYHIPALTGASLDMVTFLELAGDRIPTLAGIKYTSPTVHEYLACREHDDRRLDILWGCDEMLLSALSVGAEGAVGSTYNIAAPLYREIFRSFHDGNLPKAVELQHRSVTMVRTVARWPFHSAMKEILKMLGNDCGRCRLPQARLTTAETDQLRQALDQIGFFDWARPAPGSD